MCAHRTLAHHDVELEVLHRRIEDFFDHPREAMDLVDEEHVALFEVGNDRGKIAGALDRGARGGAHIDLEFARDDVRQRGLAESRRSREQHVIEDFAAFSCCLDRHPEDLFEAFLANEFRKAMGAQRQVERHLLEADLRRGQPLRRRLGRDYLAVARCLTFRQAAPPKTFELWFPNPPTHFPSSPNRPHAAPGSVCTPD